MISLRLDDVHTYYGDSHVIQGVSLAVEEGEVVGLFGRNGAGKSTTFRSITGLVPPAQGEIYIRDKRVDGMQPHEICRLGVGYVPEERETFNTLTVANNIGVAMSKGTTWDHNRLYDVFPALENRKRNLASELSGGERQMLAIARALATDPDILLLDEPSEGLAPVIIDTIQDLLKDIMHEDMTILLSEQNLSFALELVDRCYIIENGQIKWEGTPSELTDDVINRYLSVGQSVESESG